MVITISNRYGCGALAVAHGAAERLGYEVIDEQLPVVVAKRLKSTPMAVEHAEILGESMGERVLAALGSGTPEAGAGHTAGVHFERECLREVQEAVREFAGRGNVVLIGRASNEILGRAPGVLRVYLHAPRDWRLQHVMEAYAIDQKTAAAEVDRIDRARDEYVRAYYGTARGEASRYDLTIDTSSLGLEGSTELIVRAAHPRVAG